MESESLKYMKLSGQSVAFILQKLKEVSKPGTTGKYLDELARKLMVEKKVKSSSLGYRGFPATICVSLNEELTHGIPDTRPFKEGDLVSIDVACYQKDKKGVAYHADAALTFIIGKGNKEKEKLLTIAKEALQKAIKSIKPGITTNQDIGELIENYVNSQGYSVIKEYGGHGIGNFLHTRPFIPNYKIESAEIIQPNTAICIEPLVGKNPEIKISPNNWTVLSVNGDLNAHFEHTIWVGEKNVEVLTYYE